MARARAPRRKAVLSKRQRHVFDAARRSGLIRFEHSPFHAGHCFLDDGSLIDRRVVLVLIRKGFLAPVGDALLPGDTQSYRPTDKNPDSLTAEQPEPLAAQRLKPEVPA
jgi:hypothetical protein